MVIQADKDPQNHNKINPLLEIVLASIHALDSRVAWHNEYTIRMRKSYLREFEPETRSCLKTRERRDSFVTRKCGGGDSNSYF